MADTTTTPPSGIGTPGATFIVALYALELTTIVCGFIMVMVIALMR